MGIYGALQTAVSGLKAQSHAMENISGNIANSQTTGYKRVETSFVDMIPDAPVKSQVPGAVTSYSRSTNNVRGDVQNADTETYMALNGSGFFVVEPAFGDTSGTYYTRRGDFDLDRQGYLVNGANFKLKGVEMKDGVVVGSVPQAIKIDNSFLPAKKTASVEYKLNLPQLPKNGAYSATVPGSELMDWSDYAGVTGGAIASATGAATTNATVADTVVADGQTFTVQIGATTRTYVFDTNATPSATGISIDANTPRTMAQILAAIETDIQTNVPGAATATIGVVGANIQFNLTDNYTDSVSFGGTAATALGFTGASASASPVRRNVNNIAAADADDFMKQSIMGTGITVYSETGEPINLQVRWAKIDNTVGAEKWSLYYASDTRTGAATPWAKMGEYTFNQGVLTGIAAGPIVPPASTPITTTNGTDQLSFTNLNVNGSSVGAVTINHGLKGITQFADNGGTATTTALSQNGYGAGEFISVGINDLGRVVASYSNGETREVAQIVVANFNAPNQLKRGDGGTYSVTSASGEPVLSQDGGIVGSSLEASNTDISEEFTKLIVTQQAYSANTKIVTAANEMLQETLNMMR